MRQIFIIGRRWFDRVNGNTYFSVATYVDGVRVGTTPYEYGYGDQFLQRATEHLHEAGVYPRSAHFKWASTLAYEAGDIYNYHVTDVARRRDLNF